MDPAELGPELSSLTSALGDLTGRVTAMAERASGAEDDRVAQALFEVERSLNEALRRLAPLEGWLAEGPRRG